MSTPPYVAVIGASNATEWELASAERMGQLLAEAGCVLVCGGLGGVMDAAARDHGVRAPRDDHVPRFPESGRDRHG
ncbi:MAG TPA: hypothetical protein VI276_06855 [Actinomycetota bacterium]